MAQTIHERRPCPANPTYLGRQAVVIGAGIAGLAGAGALAPWFERVIVLERDKLPNHPALRNGTPQAWHAHGLLVGGQRAFEELFPLLGEAFAYAGGVPFRVNRDLREELPDRTPMPQRDFGMTAYTMTRPLLEFTLRERVARRRNVAFRPHSRVVGIVSDLARRRATGVRFLRGVDDDGETLPADLIVDASGRGQVTIAFLESIGRPTPAETAITIDLGYTTAIMPKPDDAPADWKVVLTHCHAPESSRRAVLLPIEGNRWMMTVAGRGAERPPRDWETLLDYLQHLATPTIYRAVRHCNPMGRLARFGFPGSTWRHFERIEGFPDGLLPIGDAICRFNPIYGQGMSVAAKEAVLLYDLLGERASDADPLAGLAEAYLGEASTLIETPWSMAAVPDFAFPETRGDRPADFDRAVQFGGALARLAMRDAAMQRLMVEVWHMLKARSVYQEPEVMQRVHEEMALA